MTDISQIDQDKYHVYIYHGQVIIIPKENENDGNERSDKTRI